MCRDEEGIFGTIPPKTAPVSVNRWLEHVSISRGKGKVRSLCDGDRATLRLGGETVKRGSNEKLGGVACPDWLGGKTCPDAQGSTGCRGILTLCLDERSAVQK